MVKNTSYEDWLKIGAKAKELDNKYIELFDLVRDIPKKDFDSWGLQKKISSIKSRLEDRFHMEHPDKFDTHVFYGYEETPKIKEVGYLDVNPSKNR